ncbi:hypothetical protein BI343_15920 [Chromobacterium amazonense]|nr:hypothetical protein BI343_15920 [Chromobacterium amazonense]
MKKKVEAVEQEVTTAIALHESWKPIVIDSELQNRMGESLATNTFNIIRWSLRREMLLALLRVWDKDGKTASIREIIKELRKSDTLEKLIASRNHPSPIDHLLTEHLRGYLPNKIKQVDELFNKYTSKDGESAQVLLKLTLLRNVTLAHHQLKPVDPEKISATDEQIESFHQDTCRIVEQLMNIVCATELDMNQTTHVYSTYARFFWASAKGERTPGHPSYRKATQPEYPKS